jgi:hypothetical protein
MLRKGAVAEVGKPARNHEVAGVTVGLLARPCAVRLKPVDQREARRASPVTLSRRAE